MRWLAFMLLGLSMTVLAEVKSGYEFLSETAKEMQDDEFQNPGMDVVEQGRVLFDQMSEDDNACSDCHGEDGKDLDVKKIATYPIFSDETQSLRTLQDQVHFCWENRMGQFPMSYDQPEAIALETFARYRARGEKVNVTVTDSLIDDYELGRIMYNTRFGQMNMTCNHCHVMYPGRMLRGQKLTYGQTNGFPVYRFGTEQVTSLHQRLDECFVQLRADKFEVGSKEYKALELFMAVQGSGLEIETPGVRY